MQPNQNPHEERKAQEKLRRLFNVAAAMSLAVIDRLDAEPEMAGFLAEVKAHPEQRPFVVKLFLEAFSDTFPMRWAPVDMLMYCMSDLRWAEIQEFVAAKRDEDIREHGRVCYNIWPDILESFEDNWRTKYFQDLTKRPEQAGKPGEKSGYAAAV
jgi:hypothetical protein